MTEVDRLMGLVLAFSEAEEGSEEAQAEAAIRSELEALVKDAERYRWVAQFLDVGDHGDDTACYSLTCSADVMEEAACRAKAFGILEYLAEEPDVDVFIDAAIDAARGE